MIDIRTTTVPKREGSGGSTTIINNGGGTSSVGSLYGHSIWGQYFNGSDIKGTLYDVHNIFATGNINADGSVNSAGGNITEINTKQINIS